MQCRGTIRLAHAPLLVKRNVERIFHYRNECCAGASPFLLNTRSAPLIQGNFNQASSSIFAPLFFRRVHVINEIWIRTTGAFCRGFRFCFALAAQFRMPALARRGFLPRLLLLFVAIIGDSLSRIVSGCRSESRSDLECELPGLLRGTGVRATVHLNMGMSLDS